MAEEDGSYPEPVPGRIAVVGVCAAGKSALVDKLRARGYDARHCGQEHSYVPDMWRRLSRPEVLVYLDASLATIRRRRNVSFGADYIETQRRRLAHARYHATVRVNTDPLSEDEVLEQVVGALEALGVTPVEADLSR
jgi:deoxyadenosine/deoxycytidine kinase